MNYMGIDHHKQYSHMTTLDENGEKRKSGRVLNKRKEVEDFLDGIEGEMNVVIEAGRATYTMVEMMEDLGIEVKIAHPLQVKAIAQARIKTDKRDSKILADLLRTNLIPEVYRRERENREAQRIFRHRMFYVGMQTKVKNRIRALLSKQREEIQEIVELENNLFGIGGMKVLKGIALGERDQKILNSLIKTLEHYQEQIKESDAFVNEVYNDLEEARLIRTIPGFGKFFSVLVAVEIGGVERFSSSAKLHSYAGVIPSTYSSGEKSYHGRLVRQGNKWLRWAVIEAVWPAIRSDLDIKVYFERKRKHKDTNVAKVATARRLLSIIYRVLKDKRAYVPYKRNIMNKDSVAF